MYLLEEDSDKLNYLYSSILSLLKQELLSKNNMSLKNALGYIDSFYYKIVMKNNDSNIEPTIYNLSSDGILSLCGYHVCRNTNTFLYDFLKELNFKPIRQHIYIDENNVWHRVNVASANHLVVCVDDDNEKLYLDLCNRHYYNSDVKSIDINDNNDINELVYNELIEDVRNIINKYKELQNFGIKYIYSYKY